MRRVEIWDAAIGSGAMLLAIFVGDHEKEGSIRLRQFDVCLTLGMTPYGFVAALLELVSCCGFKVEDASDLRKEVGLEITVILPADWS